ncbi:MAG: L,D-transpeptidase, partial [Anaerolineae bacterium]|nr:L,D-transpeptidase [Anaerolineae bacterium]
DMGILEAPLTPLVAPAPPTIFEGRQVVVDLSDQMTYAYENGVLVRSVLVSTGLPGTPTVQGDYKVYRKYAAQTMSGPGYYLPDVPYVMYFYQGYALHGTYWHNNFGNPMSHGCVNMPTPESEWFFNNFVDVGTPVHVQY